MCRVKEHYHNQICQQQDGAECLEFISDKQWQKETEKVREELQTKYGYGTMTQIKYGEFLIKNS